MFRREQIRAHRIIFCAQYTTEERIKEAARIAEWGKNHFK